LKPAWSVIFFSVGSGAGLGLTFWVLVWQLLGLTGAGQPQFWIGAGLGGVLLTFGLVSSTRHLANPKNAWRSLTRVGSSWLSREGLLALLCYPLAGLHLWLSLARSPRVVVTGPLLALLALGVVFCTAMIYACLKTVPRWRTWHTPVLYLLYALASGLLLWIAITDRPSGPLAQIEVGDASRWAFALLIGSALVKALFLAKFSQRRRATINDALAVPPAAAAGAAGRVQGRVRLLDPGHSHPTFLTNEFGFRIARERAAVLRGWMFALTLVAPLLLLRLLPDAQGLAALCMLAGLLIERWLFFAEAAHVVRLYHGQQAV